MRDVFVRLLRVCRRRRPGERGRDVEAAEARQRIEAWAADVLRGGAHDLEELRRFEGRPRRPDPGGGARHERSGEARSAEEVVARGVDFFSGTSFTAPLVA